MNTGVLSFLATLGFIAIHLFSQKLTFKQLSLRKFLSFSGGVGASYVFVHLLPEVSSGQRHFMEQMGSDSGIIRYFIPIVSLLGFAVFYTMEHLVATKWGDGEKTESDKRGKQLFWFHVFFFSVYSAMIGYLVASDPYSEGWRMLLYFLALGLHFITIDWTLRRHHEQTYDSYGRYLLVLGILLGWVIGFFVENPEIVGILVEAFVSGAIIVNAVKEELPSKNKNNPAWFLFGMGLTAILFIFL